MTDALLSPAVGGTMWTLSAGVMAFSSRSMSEGAHERNVPLMGVLGAFVFAVQMITFSIPGTGSSGHLGGGLLLAVLLGPAAAFTVIASVLVTQALFFADGGLLALGCNIFNLGFFPAFIAYPFLYRRIASPGSSPARIGTAAVASALLAAVLGALGVALETAASGVAQLPLSPFALLMVSIHCIIGIAEGMVTAAILIFLSRARAGIMDAAGEAPQARGVAVGFLAAALLAGGLLSWYASTGPDGLEWAMAKTAGTTEIAAPRGIHALLHSVQESIAPLPGYSLPGSKPTGSAFPQKASTSLSGIVGGLLTLALSFLAGSLLKRSRSAR